MVFPAEFLNRCEALSSGHGQPVGAIISAVVQPLAERNASDVGHLSSLPVGHADNAEQSADVSSAGGMAGTRRSLVDESVC
jgi:hypothetical protein